MVEAEIIDDGQVRELGKSGRCSTGVVRSGLVHSPEEDVGVEQAGGLRGHDGGQSRD